MFVLKAVTVIAAGFLTLLALRYVMRELEAAKVRVRTRQPQPPRSMTRLRQDPRTGIYYPED
jgi:hypothetical protein